MTERLNFYDFYGYLVPGVAFLAIVWLPFGVVALKWPPSDLGSAVAALIVAYIVGLTLQTIVVGGFPSICPDSEGNLRYPSGFLLDPSDGGLGCEIKKAVAFHTSLLFGINVRVGQSGREEVTTVDTSGNERKTRIDHLRREAFFLARSVLVGRKLAAYSEQSQGMYAMMGGLAIAFWLGFAYLLGWAATFHRIWVGYAAWPLLAVGLLFATVASFVAGLMKISSDSRKALTRVAFFALGAILMSLGCYASSCHGTNARQAQLLFVISVLSLLAGARCYAAYKYFAVEFGKAVWRDFVAFRLAPPPSAS